MNFVIDVIMKNGETWRTVRRTRADFEDFIQCLLGDDAVERFIVEEK